MITSQTADALDALALEIFNPADGSGLTVQDANMDAQLVSLIAPVMKVIDGRDLALGFKYTLNVTNALQLRAKHWYLRGVSEYDSTSLWPANTAFEYMPSRGVVRAGTSSFGYTIGLATCAAICKCWSTIIRAWLAGNYPY